MQQLSLVSNASKTAGSVTNQPSVSVVSQDSRSMEPVSPAKLVQITTTTVLSAHRLNASSVGTGTGSTQQPVTLARRVSRQ
jgi:hypothetical protein